MATLAVNDLSTTGKSLNTILTAAAVGGDKYPNSGVETVVVKNGSGSSITVTATAVNTCSHGSLHNAQFTVAAGDTFVLPALDMSRFNDATGLTSLTYSAVATVTVGVIRR